MTTTPIFDAVVQQHSWNPDEHAPFDFDGFLTRHQVVLVEQAPAKKTTTPRKRPAKKAVRS